LRTKAAVNILQQATLGGLAEALHFAQLSELSLDVVAEVILAGPLASDLIRLKLPKMITREFSPQAIAADAYKGVSIVAEVARDVDASTPYLDLTVALYEETVSLGNGALDLSAIITAIEARTQRQRAP